MSLEAKWYIVGSSLSMFTGSVVSLYYWDARYIAAGIGVPAAYGIMRTFIDSRMRPRK